MRQIFIRRTGNSVTFDPIDIDITETVFFTNLDTEQPHWPAFNPKDQSPDFIDHAIGPAPSASSSQIFVPQPPWGRTQVVYGCRVSGHDAERGIINVFPQLVAVANTALTATNGQATNQPVVVGGKPPYLITGLIVNNADVPGSSMAPGQTLPIGAGVELAQDESGISVVGTPTEVAIFRFTFTVDDSMGRNLQQIQYLLTVPELAEEFEHYQERYVDIAVQEQGANAEFQPVITATPLRQKGTYRVRVSIGHQVPLSVMIGDVPPMDPLLPPSHEGHELEVALYEKDFEALSSTLQELYLPRIGSSAPVYFEIRAPESKGVAEARIGIYYENNLVQSFLLKANVNSDPTEQSEPIKLKLFVIDEQEDDTADQLAGKWIDIESDRQVLSALTFTQSVGLGNLAEFGRRELSIGINDDVTLGNHTFMIKTDGEAKGLLVKDKILEKHTKAFRDLLKANTHDAKENPIFETYPSAADVSKPNFLNLVQELIEMGSKLYGLIYNDLPEAMRAKLSDLARQSDKTVQVVRFDMRNVFPWQIVYDYQLPTKIAGAPPPEICLGYEPVKTESGKPQYPGKKCSHGPFDEVYCLSGFWGLRLQIEQLFKVSSDKTDTIKNIVPAATDSFIRLAVSTDDDPAKKLTDSLTTDIGAAFVNSASSQDLLDLMWNDSARPAVLVVMGHFETDKIDGEPEEERIILVPKQKWFLASTILKRLQKAKGQRWKQPNTLVLLMACSSGATEITTLNNFVTNLNSAGAAAVLGTECLVFSSLVGRFAQEVISDLWQQRKLGEAVKFFNRRLVSAGNPLAFVFNSLGNADLELIKPN